MEIMKLLDHLGEENTPSLSLVESTKTRSAAQTWKLFHLDLQMLQKFFS